MYIVEFDVDVIISVNEGSVANFVAVLHLRAVHGHLRGTVNSDGQSTSAGAASIDDEVSLHT